jgi:phosphoribosylanthranilate isomerase
MGIDVKICGLTDPESVAVATEGGAAWVGFVFFPPSPRNLSLGTAELLTAEVPGNVKRVGLFVEPEDAFIDDVMDHVELDMIQLHGREPVARVEEIKARFQRPVMKAVGIAGHDDLLTARSYEEVADRLLFDAKAPPGATRPGGNALAFDWSMIAEQTWDVPWMLAGGLDIDNLARAVEATGATAVDVSSGVEDAPGLKNPHKIKALLDLAKAL